MNFKIGQKIAYSGRAGYNGHYYSQIKGTVVDINRNKHILVEFDRNVGGHAFGGGDKGSRWWFSNSELSKGIESSNVCVNVRSLI